MNYADLFRVTLPETALEVAALLVLVVDLGLLRKAALNVRAGRGGGAGRGGMRRGAGDCADAGAGRFLAQFGAGSGVSCCWQRAD